MASDEPQMGVAPDPRKGASEIGRITYTCPFANGSLTSGY